MSLNESPKIATCCYCGSRALLQLNARGGHELACGTCGAPLHEMKAMPLIHSRAKPEKPRPAPKGAAAMRHGAQPKKRSDPPSRKSKPKKKKGWAYWLGEAIDEISDIFD